jgi:hypothetical protein
VTAPDPSGLLGDARSAWRRLMPEDHHGGHVDQRLRQWDTLDGNPVRDAEWNMQVAGCTRGVSGGAAGRRPPWWAVTCTEYRTPSAEHPVEASLMAVILRIVAPIDAYVHSVDSVLTESNSGRVR